MKRSFPLLLLLFCVSCTNYRNEDAIVNFTDSVTANEKTGNEESKDIYIAIASVTSPKETLIYYNELIDHISKKLDCPIYIKQKRTYEEVNLLLENSEVDFAFICSGAFAENHKQFRLLVAPEIDKKIVYNAYIIVQKESTAENFSDLENKSFAFTDPLSNTGRLYPLKELSLLNKKEEIFFKKTIYTYGHDISIQMVNRGIIDGASVHGIIFDYLTLFYPERVENVKVIKKSEDFGIPPIVTPISLSESKFNKYQKVFLDLHKDSVGANIMEKLRIDRFIKVDDSIYNSVLQLNELFDNENSK